MKKIMFNDRYGLTQAVLEGKNTMTRREVKLPNGMIHRDIWNPVMSIDEVYFTFDCIDSKQRDIYPLYRIGEEVAIAQSYKQCWDIYQKQWESYNDPSNWRTPDAILGDSVQETAGWTNKMFVKAEYMPHRIRITNIKVERLQDISVEDCIKEGIGGIISAKFYSPRLAFAELIDRVSGKGTWNKNPWVFAYEFELIKED